MINCGALSISFDKLADGVRQFHAGYLERGFDSLIAPYVQENPRYTLPSTGIRAIKIMEMLRNCSGQGNLQFILGKSPWVSWTF
jgi:hypothetical protein